MRLGSGAWEGPYSFKTRFEGAPGTNPEELLGAAHAGLLLDGGVGRPHEGRQEGHEHRHQGSR